MKQQCSILMLLTRSTFYKVLLLLVGMGGLEAALFRRVIPSVVEDGQYYSLESAIEASGILSVFFAAFLLLTVLLCTTGLEGKSHVSYTLRRLSVSEGGIYLWQSFYNTLCYALLYGVQILVAVALACWYAAEAPAEVVTGQTVVLGFYRSEYLHALLPFEDWQAWSRNGVFLVVLGLVTARYPMMQRRGNRMPLAVLVLCFLVLAYFPVELGTEAAVHLSIGAVLALLMGSYAAVTALTGGDDHAETT